MHLLSSDFWPKTCKRKIGSVSLKKVKKSLKVGHEWGKDPHHVTLSLPFSLGAFHVQKKGGGETWKVILVDLNT